MTLSYKKRVTTTNTFSQCTRNICDVVFGDTFHVRARPSFITMDNPVHPLHSYIYINLHDTWMFQVPRRVRWAKAPGAPLITLTYDPINHRQIIHHLPLSFSLTVFATVTLYTQPAHVHVIRNRHKGTLYASSTFTCPAVIFLFFLFFLFLFFIFLFFSCDFSVEELRASLLVFLGSLLPRIFPHDIFYGRNLMPTRNCSYTESENIRPIVSRVLPEGVAQRRSSSSNGCPDSGIFSQWKLLLWVNAPCRS